MKPIEALTVCVGYGDFLRETLPWNRPLVDDYVVVTDPGDHETREVCRQYNVRCVLTEEHKRSGKDKPEFNKGRAIFRGVDQLRADSWVLHLDADIVMPAHLRQALEMADISEHKIYGCDRANLVGWQHWQKFKAGGWLRREWDYHCRVNFPPGLCMGNRWASAAYGWVPIGYWQLWWGPNDIYRGHHARGYPYHHSDAARSDVQHGLQWDRRHRELLGELIVIHLESEPAKLGANWKGRATKRFGP